MVETIVDVSIPLLPKVRKAFRDAPERMNRELYDATSDLADEYVRVIAGYTPEGITGDARDGWTPDVRGSGVNITGRVFNKDDEVKIRTLEGGRRPGSAPPPVAAIRDWVAAKLGDASLAYVVARSIGEHGFKTIPDGAKMVERGKQDMESEIPGYQRRLARAVERSFDL